MRTWGSGLPSREALKLNCQVWASIRVGGQPDPSSRSMFSYIPLVARNIFCGSSGNSITFMATRMSRTVSHQGRLALPPHGFRSHSNFVGTLSSCTGPYLVMFC